MWVKSILPLFNFNSTPGGKSCVKRISHVLQFSPWLQFSWCLFAGADKAAHTNPPASCSPLLPHQGWQRFLRIFTLKWKKGLGGEGEVPPLSKHLPSCEAPLWTSSLGLHGKFWNHILCPGVKSHVSLFTFATKPQYSRTSFPNRSPTRPIDQQQSIHTGVSSLLATFKRQSGQSTQVKQSKHTKGNQGKVVLGNIHSNQSKVIWLVSR